MESSVLPKDMQIITDRETNDDGDFIELTCTGDEGNVYTGE